jgi:hypothetical protein
VGGSFCLASVSHTTTTTNSAASNSAASSSLTESIFIRNHIPRRSRLLPLMQINPPSWHVTYYEVLDDRRITVIGQFYH